MPSIGEMQHIFWSQARDWPRKASPKVSLMQALLSSEAKELLFYTFSKLFWYCIFVDRRVTLTSVLVGFCVAKKERFSIPRMKIFVKQGWFGNETLALETSSVSTFDMPYSLRGFSFDRRRQVDLF